MPPQALDLTTTKCPLNFVKAKLAVEKLASGQVLEILTRAGSQEALSLQESLQREGYTVDVLALAEAENPAKVSNQTLRLRVCKPRAS
jgi:TusA-related sulfurtransferase